MNVLALHLFTIASKWYTVFSLLDFKQVEKHKVMVLVTQQSYEHKQPYAGSETNPD